MARYIESKRDTELFVAGSLDDLLPEDSVARALEEMASRGLRDASDRLTVTEADAGLKRQKDGSYSPGYNAPVVADLDSGVIVSAQVVDAGNDGGQLQPQLERAQAVLESLGAGEEKGGFR